MGWCILCKNEIHTNKKYNIDHNQTKYSNLLLRQVLESAVNCPVFIQSSLEMCCNCFELLNDFDLAEINYKKIKRKILDVLNCSNENGINSISTLIDVKEMLSIEPVCISLENKSEAVKEISDSLNKDACEIVSHIIENKIVAADSNQNQNTSSVENIRSSKISNKKIRKDVLKPYSCSECTKSFKTFNELKAHISSHSNTRPYICEICGQAYKHKYALNVHVGMHNGINPYICMYCHKSFTQKGALRRHLPIHTGDMPFQCDLCGKRFVHHSSFNVHQLSHTGEKQYKCTTCGLALLSGSHLKRHMRVHTGERNYVCNICNKRFAERYNLVAHEKLHNDDTKVSYKRNHRCNICKATFNRKLQLDEHLAKTHHTIQTSTFC